MLEIISPCFNEEKNIDTFITKVREELAFNSINNYLITIVDDGSNKKTLSEYHKYFGQKDIKIISLAKNYGHNTALLAGLNNSTANYILTLDLDLQDPIDVAIKMYKLCIEKPYDVVIGVRSKRRGESWFKLFTARLYYQLISLIANDNSIKEFSSGDFYCMNSKFKDALIINLPARLYLRGLVQSIGFKKGFYKYDRDPRKHGKTKFTFLKMTSFAISGILSVTTKPLRIITFIGIIGFIFSLFLIVSLIYWRVFFGTQTPGWTFTVVSIYLCTSIILFSLSVIAEYLTLLVQSHKTKERYFIDYIK